MAHYLELGCILGCFPQAQVQNLKQNCRAVLKYMKVYHRESPLISRLQAASLKSFQEWDIILISTAVFCINKGRGHLFAI